MASNDAEAPWVSDDAASSRYLLHQRVDAWERQLAEAGNAPRIPLRDNALFLLVLARAERGVDPSAALDVAAPLCAEASTPAPEALDALASYNLGLRYPVSGKAQKEDAEKQRLAGGAMAAIAAFGWVPVLALASIANLQLPLSGGLVGVICGLCAWSYIVLLYERESGQGLAEKLRARAEKEAIQQLARRPGRPLGGRLESGLDSLAGCLLAPFVVAGVVFCLMAGFFPQWLLVGDPVAERLFGRRLASFLAAAAAVWSTTSGIYLFGMVIEWVETAMTLDGPARARRFEELYREMLESVEREE